jgi:hypothetical protein
VASPITKGRHVLCELKIGIVSPGVALAALASITLAPELAKAAVAWMLGLRRSCCRRHCGRCPGLGRPMHRRAIIIRGQRQSLLRTSPNPRPGRAYSTGRCLGIAVRPRGNTPDETSGSHRHHHLFWRGRGAVGRGCGMSVSACAHTQRSSGGAFTKPGAHWHADGARGVRRGAASSE